MSGPDEEVALRLTREEVGAILVLLRHTAVGSRIFMTKSTTDASVASAARGAAEGCERIVAKIETQVPS